MLSELIDWLKTIATLMATGVFLFCIATWGVAITLQEESASAMRLVEKRKVLLSEREEIIEFRSKLFVDQGNFSNELSKAMIKAQDERKKFLDEKLRLLEERTALLNERSDLLDVREKALEKGKK